MSSLSTFEFDVVTVNTEGQIVERYQSSAYYRVEQLGKISLEMVAIEGGTFERGASPTEEGWHKSQSPQQLVTIDSFWISSS